MGVNQVFSEDLRANGFPSLLRKKYWVLLLIRREQVCRIMPMRRLFALLKKVFLVGTNCELPAPAFKGGGIHLPHMNGIIVSGGARVGSNCTIFHQVTLGIASVSGKEGAPIVGNNVLIGAGAKLIGSIKIGDDVRIGANAVITKDVPAGATVVGMNKIINKSGKTDDFDVSST